MQCSSDVSRAIDAYLTRSNCQYAVMVNGAWGVGKTHFIQQYFSTINTDVQMFYLSLYGLATIEDIENELLKILTENSNQIEAIDKNANSNVAASAKIGGLSYMVKYLLSAHRSESIKKRRTLTICFDDLERWTGDLNICLSFINRLVEHENIKCILIGNTDEFNPEQSLAFASAREKTIRYSYRLEIDSKSVFKIALDQVNFGSKASRSFIRRMLSKNEAGLEAVMLRINNSNIRVVIETLHLYETIYRKNIKSFNGSNGLAFTYLVSLLSALVLVRKFFTGRELRQAFLGTDHGKTMGYDFLKSIGYFASEEQSYLTDESKRLLDIVFYRLDKISLKGLFSMINNGFYIPSDFAGDFDKWVNGDLFETYLDPQQFYQLSDNLAVAVCDKVLKLMLVDRSVTNPVTLLLIVERLYSDFDKAVFERDRDSFKQELLEMINYLYNNQKMDLRQIDFFDTNGTRFQKCRGIYNYMKELNNEYLLVHRKQELSAFWKKLKKSPRELDEWLENNQARNLFSQCDDADEIIETLELLDNTQLFRVCENISNDDNEGDSIKLSKAERSKLLSFARQLRRKYEQTEGISACHLRHIAELIGGG